MTARRMQPSAILAVTGILAPVAAIVLNGVFGFDGMMWFINFFGTIFAMFVALPASWVGAKQTLSAGKASPLLLWGLAFSVMAVLPATPGITSALTRTVIFDLGLFHLGRATYADTKDGFILEYPGMFERVPIPRDGEVSFSVKPSVGVHFWLNVWVVPPAQFEGFASSYRGGGQMFGGYAPYKPPETVSVSDLPAAVHFESNAFEKNDALFHVTISKGERTFFVSARATARKGGSLKEMEKLFFEVLSGLTLL